MIYVHTTKISRRNGKAQSLNDSIAIMLRSYTRAINKETIRSGSLFREETKAVCLTEPTKINIAWYNSESIKEVILENPEVSYANNCFNYILMNPVRAGLVYHPGFWEFSSYLEYTGRKHTMTLNKSIIKDFDLKLLQLFSYTSPGDSESPGEDIT